MSDSDDKARKGITCPHCSKDFDAVLVAKFMDDYRIALKISPPKGSYAEVGAIAKSMTAMSGMLKAVAGEMGQRVVVQVERLVTTEAGEIEVHMLVSAIPAKSHNVGPGPVKATMDGLRELNESAPRTGAEGQD